jgi:hypothetical protein
MPSHRTPPDLSEEVARADRHTPTHTHVYIQTFSLTPTHTHTHTHAVLVVTPARSWGQRAPPAHTPHRCMATWQGNIFHNLKKGEAAAACTPEKNGDNEAAC